MNRRLSWFCCTPAIAMVCLLTLVPLILLAADARVFGTPEEAVKTLGEAVNTTNRSAFAALFGSASAALANPDTVQGARELADFAAAFNAANRLVRDSESQMTLEVGTNGWPLPIPLKKVPGGWQFDTQAGLEELLNRRIGQNELDVLRVLRAYVEAQRDYASQDRDNDQVLEYAQKFESSPGQTDGLFWPPSLNGQLSPLGPLFVYAQAEGYGQRQSRLKDRPAPFHGYLFKILTKQGKHAPGGKYDYVINGNMIGGFGLIAWPAEHGESGVMSFLINQSGRVHQKDLGPKTARLAAKIDAYDPDKSWELSSD